MPAHPTGRRSWTGDELLAAFRLYCRTPFGKLHQHNPDIIALAGMTGRTPSAVGMKACNFASLDPVQRARNIAALGNVSRADRRLWEAFEANPESVAAEAEAAFARLSGDGAAAPPSELGIFEEITIPAGPTEAMRLVRTRRVQAFFRASVLASYGYRCALSGIKIAGLLNASHIIPWNVSVERRADPRNGIALNALYDRAFDRGLFTFDDSLRVIVSKKLRGGLTDARQTCSLDQLAGSELQMPERFRPSVDAIRYHREHIFQAE
jgi:hypothetical protein